MLCVISKFTGYGNGFPDSWVDEISMTASAAAIYETRLFQFGYQLPDFWRHLLIPVWLSYSGW